MEEYINTVIRESNNNWPVNAVSIVKSWFKTGLEKRCITRDLKWGIPVPLDEFKDKVIFMLTYT